MNARSIRRVAAQTAAVALGLSLASCGGDSESPTSTTPPRDVAGNYVMTWTLQVLRKSDGFQKEFRCYGSLTLVQQAATGSTSSLSGFAVVGPGFHVDYAVDSGCPPESHNLRGSVDSEGAIEFTTDGARPPEGPCPGGKDVHFTGQVGSYEDPGLSTSFRTVSVRGETNVTCPGLGEHTFTYMIDGME